MPCTAAVVGVVVGQEGAGAGWQAGKREIFGKLVEVKARPAKTVVKARPCAPLSRQLSGPWLI